MTDRPASEKGRRLYRTTDQDRPDRVHRPIYTVRVTAAADEQQNSFGKPGTFQT